MTTTVATASTAAARSTSPATASSSAATTTARPATPSAISAAVRTIPGSTFPAPSSGHARNRIPIEVRFVVGKVSAAFDGQRRSSGTFTVARLAAAIRPSFAAAHLRALLLEDSLARKPDAIALNRQHFHQNLIALLELIAHILNAMLRHFADVQQPIGPRNDLDERPEIRQPRNC